MVMTNKKWPDQSVFDQAIHIQSQAQRKKI